MWNLSKKWQICLMYRYNGINCKYKEISIWYVTSIILTCIWKIMWIFKFSCHDIFTEGKILAKFGLFKESRIGV
jgi:hypothetical protein